MRDRLIDWWRRRRITAPRVDRVERYVSQADLPESLPRHQLAVIGGPKKPKWLVLECPCGEGHRLQVNLSTARQPTWRLEDAETSPNVSPSIDFNAPERRCHFWIRDGRVRWSK
jgi:Family of unknown function (DUF6527)